MVWLYVPLTGHITIWDILGKDKSMRSEPQDIGLAFDVLTPKLPCLTWFNNLIFETNVVERVNSSQISLVVTCTTGCTCHHEVTLHRNQWNKSERKRLNTNRKFCVSSDQWRTIVPIIGSCKKGVRHHGLGAADTLPREFVRFRLASASWFTPCR